MQKETFILGRDASLEDSESLRDKVGAARTSMQLGRGRSNDDVEATFAARRAQVANEE